MTTSAPERLAGTEPAIAARGLSKRYGDTTVVDDLTLEVRRGEVFALLGPNGAGKTTTVEMLAGFRHRDAGDIDVLGDDPQHAGLAWRQRVGVVPQEQLGQDELTVRETLRFGSRVYEDPWAVDDLLDAVGLSAKAESRVKNLSGGQRRRVDVALGILGQPELLFLDEPTTGFDPEARRELWGLIRTLAGTGTTILLTTHYLDEAEQLADRVGVIVAGRLVAVDSPTELGGRAGDKATVAWSEDGVRRELVTDTPTQAVLELAGRLRAEIPDLSVTRPSLEDVYLRMVGVES